MLKNKLYLLALGGLFCVGASAGVIGSFNVNGGSNGQVSVGLSGINWWPVADITGALVIVSDGTGVFSGLLDTTGTIHDLDAAAQPVGTPFSLADFLVIPPPFPTSSWTATGIFPGIYSNAACLDAAAIGQTCTPYPTSPFNLLNTADGGSTAGFSMDGTVTNGVETYGFTANFTTQFGTPYQSYLPIISAGDAVNSSWSGTITVNDNVPEPATFFLISAGLIGVGLIRRVVR